MKQKQTVEKSIFIPSILLVACLAVCILLMPESSSKIIYRLFDFLTNELGWLYLAIAAVILFFSLWAAFSKYGRIRLGGENEKKQYSEFHWSSMMFTAGMGVGVAVLSFIEPLSFLASEYFDVVPLSDKAYEYAHMYDQFLWGISGWAIYVPATLAVAYILFIKKGKVLRMSSTCEDLFSSEKTKKLSGRIIDVISVFGTVGGMATTLGMAVPTLTVLIEYFIGIPQSFLLTCSVLAVFVVIFGSSVYFGLEKGIKNLSSINMYIFGLFIIAVAFKTPLLKVLNLELNSIGLMFDNFWELTFGTDPFSKGGFSHDWVIFYWAWFLAFVPMMALFVARISKGRTVRQLVLGEIIWGAGGSMSVFALFGGYSLHLQKTGTVDLVSVLKTSGSERTIVAILETLPVPGIIFIIYALLLTLFISTTMDSTAYVLSSICTRQITGDEQPARWNRMLWALLLALFALGFILIGGLQTVQTASIVTGFPMLFVSVITMVSARKMFKSHSGKNML